MNQNHGKEIMKALSIQGSQSTPGITGDWEGGLLSMQGDSYPENSYEFFSEVIAWIESYLQIGRASCRERV